MQLNNPVAATHKDAQGHPPEEDELSCGADLRLAGPLAGHILPPVDIHHGLLNLQAVGHSGNLRTLFRRRLALRFCFRLLRLVPASSQRAQQQLSWPNITPGAGAVVYL